MKHHCHQPCLSSPAFCPLLFAVLHNLPIVPFRLCWQQLGGDRGRERGKDHLVHHTAHPSLGLDHWLHYLCCSGHWACAPGAQQPSLPFDDFAANKLIMTRCKFILMLEHNAVAHVDVMQPHFSALLQPSNCNAAHAAAVPILFQHHFCIVQLHALPTVMSLQYLCTQYSTMLYLLTVPSPPTPPPPKPPPCNT